MPLYKPMVSYFALLITGKAIEIDSYAQLIEYIHESLHFRTRVAYNFLHTKS